MKSYLKNKSIILAVAASLTVSGCATVGQDGKQTTDVAATAGMGAGIGAVVGGLIGGKRGALLGAALGGGAGFLIELTPAKKSWPTRSSPQMKFRFRRAAISSR